MSRIPSNQPSPELLSRRSRANARGAFENRFGGEFSTDIDALRRANLSEFQKVNDDIRTLVARGADRSEIVPLRQKQRELSLKGRDIDEFLKLRQQRTPGEIAAGQERLLDQSDLARTTAATGAAGGASEAVRLANLQGAAQARNVFDTTNPNERFLSDSLRAGLGRDNAEFSRPGQSLIADDQRRAAFVAAAQSGAARAAAAATPEALAGARGRLAARFEDPSALTLRGETGELRQDLGARNSALEQTLVTRIAQQRQDEAAARALAVEQGRTDLSLVEAAGAAARGQTRLAGEDPGAGGTPGVATPESILIQRQQDERGRQAVGLERDIVSTAASELRSRFDVGNGEFSLAGGRESTGAFDQAALTMRVEVLPRLIDLAVVSPAVAKSEAIKARAALDFNTDTFGRVSAGRGGRTGASARSPEGFFGSGPTRGESGRAGRMMLEFDQILAELENGIDASRAAELKQAAQDVGNIPALK